MANYWAPITEPSSNVGVRLPGCADIRAPTFKQDENKELFLVQ